MPPEFPVGLSLPAGSGWTKGPPSRRGRMVASRPTRVPLTRAWTLTTAAALGLASAGCTMCPDPFDYSGPVPNGSSPQNDFRARSNGILPLGASPRPWPLIVKNDGAPNTEKEWDEPTPTLAEEVAPADLQQTVAVVGESSEDAGADGELEAESAEAAASSPVLQAVPMDPPQEPVATTADGVPFQAGETPGWRSRYR